MSAFQPPAWMVQDRTAVRVRLWLNPNANVDLVGTRASIGCVLEDLQFEVVRIVGLLSTDAPARIVGETGYVACLLRASNNVPNENMDENENKK